MNTLDAIAARRSIRKFQNRPVSDEDIRTILQAAIQAPSGRNRQPWRFVVVREDRRAEMVRVMWEGIDYVETQGIEPGSASRSTKSCGGWAERLSLRRPDDLLRLCAGHRDHTADCFRHRLLADQVSTGESR